MSPLEAALVLFAILHRHFKLLRLGLDEAYSAEDWGFTDQKAVQKFLDALIEVRNGQPPRVNDLTTLAELSPGEQSGAAGTSGLCG